MKPKPLGKRRLIKHLDHLERKDGGWIKIWFYGQGYTFYDVKSACEFYLKYQNKPFILFNHGSHLLNEKQFIELKKIIDKIENSPPDIAFEELYPKYNEWLFKLAFKDVMGDRK